MAINKKLIHFKKYSDFIGSSGINGATSPTNGYYGNIPGNSIVFILDTQQTWTHGTFYEGKIEEAPIDDKAYVRKNGEWIPGTSLADSTETVIVNLNTNQTLPDNNIIGAIVSLTTEDGTEQQTYSGSSLTFYVLGGKEYSISVSSIENYTTPIALSYTSVLKNTRNLTFTYNKTVVTVNRTSNQSNDSLASSTFTVSYGSTSKTITFSNNTGTFEVPTGTSYTITYSAITNYKTPTAITQTAEGASLTVAGQYQTTIVTVVMADNQSSLNDIANATATINGVSVKSGGSTKVATGTNCTIKWSTVTGYKTPADLTFTTSGTSVTRTGTYLAELLTVNVSGTTEYSIAISGVGTLTTATGTYKIPYGTSYTITPSSIDGYIVSGGGTYTADSNTRTITITYAYNPCVDLSMQDIYGNTTSQNTANCYVVKEAGTYKFPCVYGNAIKNGATNATAYLNNGGTYSHNFVNYAGNLITDPWISTDTGETISSAQLSIADTDNIFTDVAIDGSSTNTYVTFKVASVPNTGANGVISIKNAAGTIMWNWHIWVWKDDLTPVTITNNTSKTYNILPINLASKWVSSSSSPTLITNWYYQFGRPTPLAPAASYNSTTNATTYGALSFTTASYASNYLSGITNPTTFYKYNSSGTYNWFSSSSYYNLWDQACTTTGCSDNTVVKTVYDPCPPGFKMPNGNTFTGFSTSNIVGSFTNGYYFKKNSSDTTGVFFPASGYRDYSSGSLSNVGSGGCVWSAAAYSQYYAYDLYFGSGYVDPLNYDYRANGFSVRPVAES